MLTRENVAALLPLMNFQQKDGEWWEKSYGEVCGIAVHTAGAGRIVYPEKDGMSVGQRTTCSFADDENLVVLECVNRLLEKGYRPEHIALEKAWNLGHEAKGGRADICVSDEKGATLFIVECKTFGAEYAKEKKNMLADGGQLFSYWQQERAAKWLVLYASTIEEGRILHRAESVSCTDDANIRRTAEKDETIRLYEKAHTVEELFAAWDETYDRRFVGDVVFRDDSRAYQIGIKPLRKKDLRDFAENDKVVNRFEEILRHNNVSDKENAFNRLIALFICKLVDESRKAEDDEMEFQYRPVTDNYESLQDRLQRLHRDGMEEFMREEIFYVEEDYAEKIVRNYTGQDRANMIGELRRTLRNLKFYTNNDFAFKDVHNEELFYQNGKILVEVVQLFEEYRIIDSEDLQTLGDLFEQLLNKGFKQNEGQFFTPIPITRFIWESLPLRSLVLSEGGVRYPRIVDYACGAGHFLTEGFEAVNRIAREEDEAFSPNWAKDHLYGMEKDYRLARVSKISLFMHGAGEGSIAFGDGLDDARAKGIRAESFDILTANPPYSVAAFKPHLRLIENRAENFAALPAITANGSEIETLFVERIAQLLAPKGVAAVILPSSILSKENLSFVRARETLLQNFLIRAIVQMGSKTFGATGTNTVILFLEKFDEPPKRVCTVADSVDAIMERRDLAGFEDAAIYCAYLAKIRTEAVDYRSFLAEEKSYDEWAEHPYFALYLKDFLDSTEVREKRKQKNFAKLPKDMQCEWLTNRFYVRTKEKEREKLTCFALVYRQKTLIISAPDDNKGQEEFLGYKWSNRKGAEGIQILQTGGMLYGGEDDAPRLADMIRAAFLGSEDIAPDLTMLCHVLPLQDMLDFDMVSFNKVIKIQNFKYSSLEYRGALPTQKLGEAAPYVTERVALEAMNLRDYITTDNMKQDKAGVVPFEGLPAVPFGTHYRAGDILISNIRPYLRKIWLSDREGACSNDVLVFRSADKEKILPEYLYYFMAQDEFFDHMMATAKGMKMPRGDKEKILQTQIPVPAAEEQRAIVAELGEMDGKIKAEEEKVAAADENIRRKFVEMFGDMKPKATLNDILMQFVRGVVYSNSDESHMETSNRILTADNITLDGDFKIRKVLYLRPGFEMPSEKKLRKNDIFICTSSGSIHHVGKSTLIEKDVDYYPGGFMGILRTNNKMNPVTLQYILLSDYAKAYFRNEATGTNIKNLSSKIESMPIIYHENLCAKAGKSAKIPHCSV